MRYSQPEMSTTLDRELAANEFTLTRAHEIHPPQALVVACSDSHLNGSFIAQLMAEPLFLWRSFGNSIPEYSTAASDVIDAMDAIVTDASVADIAVCGHSQCHCLAADADQPPALGGRRRSFHDRVLNYSRRVDAARQHTRQQLENLMTYPCIQQRVDAGMLQVNALFYLEESGILQQFDLDANQFRALALPASTTFA